MKPQRPDMLVLIAIWQFVTAFIALIGIAGIAVFAIPAVNGTLGFYGSGAWSGYFPDTMARNGAMFGLSIGIFVLVCYMAVGVIGGIGLLMGKSWGRITSIVHEGLSMLAVPVGLVLGILSVIYLTKPEVRNYFNPPAPAAAPPAAPVA